MSLVRQLEAVEDLAPLVKMVVCDLSAIPISS